MKRGIYNTKQKEYIMNFFENNKSELFFAKDIFKIINNKFDVGLTTIYRSLDSLVDEKILMQFYGDFGKKYGYFPCNHENHFHLICENCGEVVHVDCDSLLNLSNHLYMEHLFKLNVNEMFLKGRCKKCL